jgi:hypothetical protein
MYEENCITLELTYCLLNSFNCEEESLLEIRFLELFALEKKKRIYFTDG